MGPRGIFVVQLLRGGLLAVVLVMVSDESHRIWFNERRHGIFDRRGLCSIGVRLIAARRVVNVPWQVAKAPIFGVHPVDAWT